ncbi:M50 family metallopeptidase [Paenibacillus sp. J22TS3]|uniref:M50 family metallopeptidase n=1 Tax=Paenibacillus sp. J22TS3 TaxID=2807192 RepID=UPI001B0E0C79|nr:M50 family metallopeptidase [Paenibacillus sp. J22TS3]GIP23413.1 hypothetical protein J22TS3_36880 [Paenibacillus sp. J22TS3]
MNKWLKTILFLLGSAFLTRLIPFSSWFRTVDTMVHELGHAIVTLLVSGRVMRIELNADHSGVTYSLLSTGWSSILVSLAGYTLAALFALLLFLGYQRRRQAAGLIGLMGIALLMMVFFVHRGFGVWWLGLFLLISGIIYFLGPAVRNFYYLLLAFLCLEESVMGPLTLVLAAIRSPGEAGDAANLARMTPLPAVLWAILFLIFSLWCASMSLRLFWSRRPAQQGTGSSTAYERA